MGCECSSPAAHLDHRDYLQGGPPPLRLSFIEEKLSILPLQPSCCAHSARFPPAQAGFGRLSNIPQNIEQNLALRHAWPPCTLMAKKVHRFKRCRESGHSVGKWKPKGSAETALVSAPKRVMPAVNLPLSDSSLHVRCTETHGTNGANTHKKRFTVKIKQSLFFWTSVKYKFSYDLETSSSNVPELSTLRLLPS